MKCMCIMYHCIIFVCRRLSKASALKYVFSFAMRIQCTLLSYREAQYIMRIRVENKRIYRNFQRKMFRLILVMRIMQKMFLIVTKTTRQNFLMALIIGFIFISLQNISPYFVFS